MLEDDAELLLFK
jgi:hypothetical protein